MARLPRYRLARGAVRVAASAVRFVRYPPPAGAGPATLAPPTDPSPDAALALPGGTWLTLPGGDRLALPVAPPAI